MKNNVTRIDDGDYFAEFSEFRVMEDEERFAMTEPRLKLRWDVVMWWTLTALVSGSLWAFGTMVFYEFFKKAIR